MRSSIRSKLFFIFFFLGFAPFLISGYATYHTISHAMLTQSNGQISKLIDKTAEQIDSFLKTREKEIELLANFPFIQLSFLQFEFGQRLDTARRLLRGYGKKNDYFRNIYLINMKGKTILVEPQPSSPPPFTLADISWFSSTIERDLCLSITRGKGPSKAPVILLSKLVYDFENSKTPVGMILFDIRLSAFTKFVSSIKIGNHGYACLWDNNGEIIYHPDPSLSMVGIPSETADRRLAALMEKMKNRERGSGDYTYCGQKKNLIFAPCNTIDWRISVSLRESELMADIILLRHRMLFFFALISCLLLGVLFFFDKSISSPIHQLIEGVRAIGSGRWGHFIQVDSSDELQDLAHEFNKMSVKLKKSIDEIIELKNFNDDILRSVHNGIITINREYQITSCNAGAQEIMGMAMHPGSLPLQDLLSSPVDEIMKLLQNTLEQHKAGISRQIEFQSPEGGKDSRLIEVNTYSLKNSREQTVGAIVIMRDITQKKLIEDQMIRVDRLASLGELSAGMAHEIRNPLAGIKTGTQILAKRVSGGSGQVLIQGILSEIDRMNKIVTDLLNFSRPKQPLLEWMDLSDTMERALALVGKSMKNAGITLCREFQSDLPFVLVDREQMEQVFLNLLINGVNSMPVGGRFSISIKSRRSNSFLMEEIPGMDDPELACATMLLEVVLQDTGHGIKKEILSRIFNPFYTTNPKGSGLGLSIVHKLLEKNRGYININSVENQGTRVTLLFPTVESGSRPNGKTELKSEIRCRTKDF